ncbi:hypothetical protein GF108_08935 [Phyllobacterium sp. SYP-B3895]|uniref:hypothetical protein n=1 Tax=Phyllobacterium sp. SYP-B3895 TaxID=2663240 RepID=UPI001299F8F2|nr:hypothetical protein [Phyllobacterium sp. SYP-B3895]MRG55706.1 hypothetical protein [Phyllobacterium sp. SYP-B3895]
MAFRKIALNLLLVNRANDRHGELENETAAIAWLFNEREAHMRNLAKDIVVEGEIYETPLVAPVDSKYVVFDGNRRITCLKLLDDPRRAPTSELQAFFREQRANWKGVFPIQILCQVESDRDRIDEILYRRHTGTQNGIGQSNWDDRMKTTFVSRTGKGGGVNVADEIEKLLAHAKLLPAHRKIPRSTMNRLLSAEPFRNRVGFSVNKGRFEFTHDQTASLAAMARIARDLAERKVVLSDIWDVDGKSAYLDGLAGEGVLPPPLSSISVSKQKKGSIPSTKQKSASPTTTTPTTKTAKPVQRKNLIPHKDYGLVWPGRLQRHHQIWEELQYHLELARHPNAIAVLLRVLIELSAENYIQQQNLAVVHTNDKLAVRVQKIGSHMQGRGKLDKKQVTMLAKFQHTEELVSADTLNRYVHSPNFAPSSDHLTAIWDSLSEFIVLCLEA